MKPPDDNDLLQAGILSRDPTADAEPFKPPGTAEWETPIPLRAVPDPPAFPVEVLPAWLGEWVTGTAEALQCPPDLPGVLGLTVLSLALAKKAVVEVKGGWQEPLNLYLVIALPSGESKSPAFRAAMAPVEAWERERRQQLRSTILAEREERAHLEARLEHLRKKAARAQDPREREEAIAEAKRLSQALAERVWTVAPRLVLTDVTPEKLVVLLQEQDGRMAILSDEGGPFDQMAGRYRDGPPNLDVYLQAYSRGTVIVERVGRAPSEVHEAALTFGLTVQPEVIRELRNQPGFRGRGLLARFLFAVPASRVGSRHADPDALPEEVRRSYEAGVGGLQDWGSPGSPLEMPVAPEGRAALVALKAELEPRIGPGGDLEHLADWVNKLPGAVVRVAGLLHLAAEAESGARTRGRAVSQATVERAVRLGGYFLGHARAAFDLMEEDAVVGEARRMLAWVRRRGDAAFSERDVYRGLRGVFRSPSEMAPVFDLLEAHFWIRRQEGPEREGPGRRPSPRWEVHPSVMGQIGHNGQNPAKGHPESDSVQNVHSVQPPRSGSSPPQDGAEGRDRPLCDPAEAPRGGGVG